MIYAILPILITTVYLLSQDINKRFFSNSVNPIINSFIFVSFLTFLSIVKSYFNIFNLNSKFISYFFALICILYFVYNFKKIFLNLFTFIKIIYEKKIVFFFFLCYFILIFFPAFDEDTLRYHLPIAERINQLNFFNYYWLDYITIGTHEFINSFFLDFNFEYGASYLNFTALLYIILAMDYLDKKIFKNQLNYYNILILISSPYFISLMLSQKFYLLPSYIAVISILYLYFFKTKINNLTFLLISSSVIFMLATKLSFVFYFILFYLIFIYFYKKKINLILSSVLIFLILYYPIIHIKYFFFKDPLLPLLNINHLNYEWFLEYKIFLTGMQMDYSQNFESYFAKMIFTPIKLVLPFTKEDIFKCFAASILFFFTIRKNNKFLLFLSLFMFFNVFLLQNTQTRWFLPFVIYLCYFANCNKFISLKKLLKLQSYFSLLFLIIISILLLLSDFRILRKNLIKDYVQSSHKIINDVNLITKKENVFTDINHWYRLKNNIPIYHPKIATKQNSKIYSKISKDNDYLLWSNKYNIHIDQFLKNYLNCKDWKLLKIYKFNNTRFFLINNNIEVKLYTINNCY